MKQRILTGWTFTRALYVLMGALIIAQSVAQQQWPGILFGGYLASMGILAYGCAAGNCLVPNRNADAKPGSKVEMEEIQFEEIKTK